MIHKTFTVIVVCAAIIFISYMLGQYANAEELYGNNTNTGIFVAFDGDLSMIFYKSAQGTSTHYDATVTEYKHGGFILKSPQIVIFGHPLDQDKYTLLVMTSNGFERFVASDYHPIKVKEEPKIQPEIPVESDTDRILREYYESKTDSARSADSTVDVIVGYSGQVKDHFKMGEDFWLAGIVENIKTSRQQLDNATVSYEISREGFVLREDSAITKSTGYVKFKVDALTYPEFYPRMCYTMTITTEWNGYSNVQIEEFVMVMPRVWNPTLDWVNLEKYSDLPESYKTIPRTTTFEDEHCN